jgi:hypothetical protein
MRNCFLVLTLVLISSLAFGQQEADALEGNHNLNERFDILKTKSQSYKEYKVIKGTVLDSFWKIIRDSVATKKAMLAEKDKNIAGLKNTLAETQAALKEREASMKEVVHDSTHINAFGISFAKSVFITLVVLIVGALVLLLLLISGRLKMIHKSLKDRADAFTSLSNEFEEYKRKAMEKQTKLSRELQTERNRLSENRGGL